MQRVVLAAVLALNLALGMAATTRATHEPTLVASEQDPYTYWGDLQVGREHVAWLENLSSGSALWAASLHDRAPLKIVDGLLDAYVHFDLGDGVLVWAYSAEGGDAPVGVFSYDLTTGTVSTLSTDQDVVAVSVTGHTVVWATRSRDDGGAGDPWVLEFKRFDLGSDDQPQLLGSMALTEPSDVDIKLSRDRVFWWMPDNSVWWLPLSGGDPSFWRSFGIRYDWDAAGDLIVVAVEPSLYMEDITTGALVGYARHLDTNVATDGRYLYWGRWDVPGSFRLMSYDVVTGSLFLVDEIDAIRERAIISEISAGPGVVSWSVDSIEGVEPNAYELKEIHGSFISDRLPSASRIDPRYTSDVWTFYPETGHFLGGEFRAFWQRSGGLGTFGYPLTEEFVRYFPPAFIGTQPWLTQYVERQRFEWHPENAGTPYQVLLGRLGAELLARQGRDWTAFPTADPNAPHYMDVTGHAIAPQFWEYWSSHGLDLSDPGVSFRKSLALFGYPLSEAMVETNADGDTVLTQYFERAVFEWHPDNPDPWKVLLRRLGAEALAAQGW